MKTVFSTRETPHIWAQRSQDTGKGGNVFFQGDRIYSYGHHYVMAMFHGQSLVLMNENNYSSSTAGHKSTCRQAIDYNQYKVIEVPNPDPQGKYSHKTNLNFFEQTILTCIQKQKKARVYDYICDANNVIESAKYYIEQFKAKKYLTARQKRLFYSTDLVLDSKADVERIEKAEANKKAKAQRKYKIALKEWRIGESNWLPRQNNDNAVLRISGDNLETSQNISIPLTEAKRIFDIVIKCKNENREFVTNGKRITIFRHYNLDYIKTNGDLKAGCHSIKWEETQAIAKTQGWL
jgi:hypothetical protein